MSQQGLLPEGWQRYPPIEKMALLQRLRAQPSAPVTEAESIRRDVRRIMAQAPTTELFIENVLGWKATDVARSYGYTSAITPQQQAVVHSVRVNRRTAVPAGHGVGKTKIAAAVVVDFLFRYEDCIIVTTAPTWTAVKKLLWGEIRQAWKKARVKLPGKLTTSELQLDEKWYAIGLSTRGDAGGEGMGATKFQGHHAPRMLIVYDEATGVDEAIKIAAEGLAVGEDDRYLAIGNPTDPTSWFKAACDSGRWNVIRLDCREHPNVIHNDGRIIPGAVTKLWVDERREEYGGEDTPLFRAKVSGEWPDERENQVITLAMIARAQAKAAVLDLARGDCLSCDVARYGDDFTTISLAADAKLTLERLLKHRDTTEVAGELIKLVAERQKMGRIVRLIVLDDTGVGAGVTDALKHAQRQGYWIDSADGTRYTVPPVNVMRIWPINFAQSAWNHKKFAKIKHEMWWTLREALERDLFALGTEEEFARHKAPLNTSYLRQLTAPFYTLDTIGRVVVFDKRDPNDPATVSLPAKSPDIAHALMLAAFGWVRMAHLPRLEVDQPKTVKEMFTRDFHGDLQQRIAKTVSRDKKTLRTLRKVR
jgi:phage terminase large subunit